MIDLHMHSTFSDGSFEPEALVRMARELGLYAVALTDHDGTGGLDRFMAACAAAAPGPPLLAISGVEISVDVDAGTMHMLGYGFDRRAPGLKAALARVRTGREARNARILDRLNALGMDLTWEAVARHAGEDVVGRPHFAAAMQESGFVDSRQDAFGKWLAKGRPAYVERYRLGAAEAIRAIGAAGGVAVLAHPGTLGLGPRKLRADVGALKAAGLGGIEVHHSTHSAADSARFLALAREFDLVATGGSDFHGAMNPAIALGRGFGRLKVPDSLADALLARCAAVATESCHE